MTTYFRVGDLIQWKHPTIASAFGHTKERAWYGVVTDVDQKADHISVGWFGFDSNKIDPMGYGIRWSENNFVRL